MIELGGDRQRIRGRVESKDGNWRSRHSFK